ncbi:MAG: hypothetical protein KUG65_04570, partial [Sphingomonadaceae bacterium]|nr:hypothetical protein [Sphingomonadaceae bacterium]
MDNLRGNFPEYDDAFGDAQDFDLNEDEAGDDLPPAAFGEDERRMQVRAYNFWAAMLGDRKFPAAEDLDPESQGDFGPYGVLLDFSSGIEDPAIVFLGDKLASECGATAQIERLSDVPSRSLLSRITDHYLQIIANQAPIGFEAEFVNQRGTTILYRGILLPFSSDNDTIDFIYGIINWKELADQQTADELLLEIDQALEPHFERETEQLPMTDWADGPAEDMNVLDLDAEQETSGQYASLQAPSFTARTDDSDRARALPTPLSPPPTGNMALADWLASARDLADEVRTSESRTRQALYGAISRAYDFSLAAAQEP